MVLDTLHRLLWYGEPCPRRKTRSEWGSVKQKVGTYYVPHQLELYSHKSPWSSLSQVSKLHMWAPRAQVTEWLGYSAQNCGSKNSRFDVEIKWFFCNYWNQFHARMWVSKNLEFLHGACKCIIKLHLMPSYVGIWSLFQSKIRKQKLLISMKLQKILDLHAMVGNTRQ